VFVAQVCDALRAEKVDFDSGVEWGVERHRGCRVDDHISAEPGFEVFAREIEAVGAHIARNSTDATSTHFGERFFAHFFAQAVEGVVFEHVAVDSSLGPSAAGTHQQDEFTVWDTANEPLNEGGTEETGRAGNGDALSCEVFDDHCFPFYHWIEALYQLVESFLVPYGRGL